ncbi:hypothetical protein UZ36_03435 [Candidatus Nitromaritima sp. SCGC AAA799-C22]|nr:hypothetical protein UZ36_03435 [Candidatus Nitromaritima sp. SCGC AAA799-C22]
MTGFKTGLAVVLMFFSTQAPLKTITGKVVTVHQGDTFTIKSIPPKEKLFKVRLSNVDSPEIKQPFGHQAKLFTMDQIAGKRIQVKYNMVDLYGRLVGYVVLPQGNILNEELIRAGLAWHYRVVPSPSTALERLEYEAWEKKLGLWIDPSPTPPWEFRREGSIPRPPSKDNQMDYDLILSYGIIGDPKERVYWWPGCKDYPKNAKDHVVFGYKLLAESMGYRSSSGCDITNGE